MWGLGRRWPHRVPPQQLGAAIWPSKESTWVGTPELPVRGRAPHHLLCATGGPVPIQGSYMKDPHGGSWGALKARSTGQVAWAGNKWEEQPGFRACIESIRSSWSQFTRQRWSLVNRPQVYSLCRAQHWMPSGHPETWRTWNDFSGTRGQYNDLSLSSTPPGGCVNPSFQTPTKLYLRGTGRMVENQKVCNT